MTEPSEEIKYYAVVASDRTRDNPGRLIRRRFVQPGPVDEALQRDLSWRTTTGMLMVQEYGDFGPDYVEIGEDEAERLIERFRAKWSAEDGASS